MEYRKHWKLKRVENQVSDENETHEDNVLEVMKIFEEIEREEKEK